jgi:hypothetical protein
LDVPGFILATGFLVAVYAVFGVVGHVLDVVSAGIRSTVAPTMLSGFQAWTGPVAGLVDATRDETDGPEGSGGPDPDDRDPRPADERRLDPGLVVPPTRLDRHVQHRFAAA